MKETKKRGELWESLESGSSFSDGGTAVDERQRCSRRTTKKNGRMQQEVQIKKAGEWRKHHKRWKQSKGEERMELKKEATRFKVHPAQRVDLEHREKVHEKIQRRVPYLFRDRAQIEEGGNGGAVQQRSQGRMEIRS